MKLSKQERIAIQLCKVSVDDIVDGGLQQNRVVEGRNTKRFLIHSREQSARLHILLMTLPEMPSLYLQYCPGLSTPLQSSILGQFWRYWTLFFPESRGTVQLNTSVLTLRCQHDCPLLVVEPSMTSSVTRKNACKNSTHQPRIQASRNSSGVCCGLRSLRGNVLTLSVHMCGTMNKPNAYLYVAGTASPLFFFPFGTLYWMHLARCLIQDNLS